MVANQQIDHTTVDGLPAVDDKIETIDPASGKLDPTNEEAQRALAIMNGQLNEDGSPIVAAPKTETTAPKQFEDTERNNIAKNFRDSKRGKREGDDQPLDIAGADDQGPNSDAMKYGTAIANANKPAAAPVEEKVEPQAAAPAKVRVKIDGIEHEVTQDELIANFQIGEAARLRLQQATEILNSAKTVRDGAPIKADGEDPKTETSPSTTDTGKTSTPNGTKIDLAKVAKAVETIQLGTIEDGVAAFEDLLTSVAPQQNSLDIRGAVREVIASDRIQVSSEEATSQFVAKYPAIANDGILQKVTGEIVAQEMAKDFLAVGIDAKTIAETMPTPAHVKAAHDLVRMKNPAFGRPLAKLYEEAEKSPHFQALTGSKPAPQVKIDLNRDERKSMVQQQPSHRTTAPITAAQTVPLTREQKMSQAVKKQQIDRGQSVAA